jgi:hypothetical protein
VDYSWRPVCFCENGFFFFCFRLIY